VTGKKPLLEINDITLAGERRRLTVAVPEHIDVLITVNGESVPLFPDEVKKLITALRAHYVDLILL